MNITFMPLLFQLQLVDSSLVQLPKGVLSLVHQCLTKCRTFSISDLKKAVILTF